MRPLIKKYNDMTILELQQKQKDMRWILISVIAWFAVFGFLATLNKNNEYWYLSIIFFGLTIVTMNTIMHLSLLIYAKRNEQLWETLYLKNNLEVNKDATC